MTIRKVTTERYPPPTFEPKANDMQSLQGGEHVPAHRDFREKYFLGFKKGESEGVSRETLNSEAGLDALAVGGS